ncbi:RNA-binding NOB1-like protein [Syzygium oleosum]|uniref:RNA-binding NOB1-like protein n=1 Tax=Syzygium oleosum TaxID=219896 RepID=UPI0024BAE3B8|nr:RNA-binding NOB1-like protein [Syzygium oleosum]
MEDAPPPPSPSPAAPPPAAAQPPCWSNIVKAQPQAKVEPQSSAAATAQKIFVGSCNSSRGVSVAVVDANAIIEGGEKLRALADRFVSVPEVMGEVRDPVSRRRLEFVPFSVETMEPSPEALNKVIKFARATGDLQTLSDVDLKLIALTYMLEAQIHGINHLRDCPLPVHTVNIKRLPENDMPGWGKNVSNLEEWEALEHEAEEKANTSSRILPLKDLNLNIIPEDSLSKDDSAGDNPSVDHENAEGSSTKHRRFPSKKKEITIEGKKMVADGIDASQGQVDDDAGDWLPAVSRSTHRRYLRRKARREHFETLSEKESQQDAEKDIDDHCIDDIKGSGGLSHHCPEEVLSANGTSEESEIVKGVEGSEDLSSILKQMRLEEDSASALREEIEHDLSSSVMESDKAMLSELTSADAAEAEAVGRDDVDNASEETDQLENSSQTNESNDASYLDDQSSEQSWVLRSLSESSVACITGDFAMQNVILQMGLRLLASGGMQIRQLHRWILKCHACYTVTAEIGRVFCPKCGNGGTLRKVAVTVNENGVVLAARRPRITLRGTRFSLPLPQGGRDAISKNLILREDQLPQKYLYPKTKKKANKEGDDFFTSDDVFSYHSDKRSSFQPPVRKALAVFSGKRNPNDNHFSRSRRR